MAVKRLPALHKSADYIFLSYGNNYFIGELANDKREALSAAATNDALAETIKLALSTTLSDFLCNILLPKDNLLLKTYLCPDSNVCAFRF